MIDDRRAAILKAVVRQYIDSCQPVSSSAVVSAAHVQASPATVRSEMAALERDGYLRQPHTSAGRVPTDLGYRFFVDNLEPASNQLGPAEQNNVKEFFAKASGEIEQMLHDTGKLLSNLTGAAALVVGPDYKENSVHGMFVEGTSRLVSAFDAIETVRNVIATLEQQYVLVTLMRDLLERDVTVSIGEEHKLQTLSSCSLVVAPTIIGGEALGSVAILGPTHMNYGQAMAAVTVVSEKLGERLGDS